MKMTTSGMTKRTFKSLIYLSLYNGLLLCGSLLCLPLIVYALVVTPKYRAGFKHKLGIQALTILPKTRQRVWIHCVSVGELNAAKPLIHILRVDWDVVISTTTATAYDLATAQYDAVFYCPLDVPWAVSSTLQQLNPDRLIVLETELWPNLFYQASRHCPRGIWVVNARLSDRSFKGYWRLRPMMAWLLNLPQAVLAQSDGDADRLRELGASRVQVMGNLKFDITPTDNHDLTAAFKHRLSADRVVVMASTHDREEALLVPVIKRLLSHGIAVIVAPRHPERAQVVVAALGDIPCVRQSVQPTKPVPLGHVLLLDTIGQLMSAYAASQLVVMGGSFIPHGGQNPLEPLALGVPVITGPFMHNFKAIMVALGQAVYQVNSPEALDIAVASWLDNETIFNFHIQQAQTVFTRNRGATQRAITALNAS
jgi:3-deoxy-D-manno-octulosonic-acid transferase